MLQSSFLEKINTSPKVCKKDEARKCEKCLKNAVPEECMEEYVVNKVETWFEEIQVLANIASTLPHAVYSAFVHGVTGQWSFVSKTILPDIQGLLQPLEDAIHQLLIPALTGRSPCSKTERDIFSLPSRLGGLGILNPSANSQSTFYASVTLTTPLVNLITAQNLNGSVPLNLILSFL